MLLVCSFLTRWKYRFSMLQMTGYTSSTCSTGYNNVTCQVTCDRLWVTGSTSYTLCNM